jgi:hypothetical protein
VKWPGWSCSPSPRWAAGWPPRPGSWSGCASSRGGRGDHDPAGTQPDPAHPRRPGPRPRDEQLLRGAGRRGGGPAGRRPAHQREPARFRLAAGLPGQRAHRNGPAGRGHSGAAARPGRARPHRGPARAGPAVPGRARVRPAARAWPAGALAGLEAGSRWRPACGWWPRSLGSSAGWPRRAGTRRRQRLPGQQLPQPRGQRTARAPAASVTGPGRAGRAPPTSPRRSGPPARCPGRCAGSSSRSAYRPWAG